MAHKKLNTEYLFTKKSKSGKATVSLSLIIDYDRKKYLLTSSNQEGVFFHKFSVEEALLMADLCKEALNLVKQELGL